MKNEMMEILYLEMDALILVLLSSIFLELMAVPYLKTLE